MILEEVTVKSNVGGPFTYRKVRALDVFDEKWVSFKLVILNDLPNVIAMKFTLLIEVEEVAVIVEVSIVESVNE